MSVDMDSEDFLEIVWGKRRGWVDLPAKVNGNWIPYYTEWDGNGCGHSITRRIDSSLRDSEDLYFSVAQFEGPGRKEGEYKPSSWLWADLDEVHPGEASKRGLTPTIAWESSRGRYQALWKLNRRVGARDHDRLNQALSYALGADYGGWDLTQVLRLPGTRNFKYEDTPLIGVLWYHSDMVYDPQKIWAKVKSYASKEATALGGQQGIFPRRPMPARAKALLRVKPETTVDGWRSGPLWELENLLIESGWGEDEIYEVIKGSAWHKWAHRRDSEAKLREDIKRAIRKKWATVHDLQRDDGDASTQASQVAHSVGVPEAERKDLHPSSPDEVGDQVQDIVAPEEAISPPVRYAAFMATPMEPPRWMIEGLWTDRAHGIIGGEPKTLKTTLALAMGMSVASGKPFLGEFDAPSQGPVLFVQEENDPTDIQDTMLKIAASYGLIGGEDATILPSPRGSVGSTVVSLRFPDDLPFYLWNNEGFDLSQAPYRDALEEQIQIIRPKMVILDPLRELFGGADLDRDNEVRGFLKGLRGLKQKYDTAIVLVHHLKKQKEERAGKRLLGATAFHGWVSSGLYFSDITPEPSGGWKKISIEREFRKQGPQDPLKVSLKMGMPGSLDFETIVGGWNKGDEVLDMVMDVPGITVNQVAKELDVTPRTVVNRARGTGRIRLEGGHRNNVRRMFLIEGGENGDSPS